MLPDGFETDFCRFYTYSGASTAQFMEILCVFWCYYSSLAIELHAGIDETLTITSHVDPRMQFDSVAKKNLADAILENGVGVNPEI